MDSGSESDCDRMDFDQDDDPVPLLLGNIGGGESPSATRKKGSSERTKSRWIRALKRTSEDLAEIFPGTQVMLFIHYTTPKDPKPQFFGKGYGEKAHTFLTKQELGKEIRYKVKVTAQTWALQTDGVHQETVEDEEGEQSPEDEADVEGSQLPKISAQASKIVAEGLAKSRENKKKKDERLAMLEARRKQQQVSQKLRKKSSARNSAPRDKKASEEGSMAPVINRAVVNSDEVGTNQDETLSEAQVNVISELFPGREKPGMVLSVEEWALIEQTLSLRGIPLLGLPEKENINERDLLKNVSDEGAEISPLRNDGLSLAKKVIGISDDSRPIETQKVVLSHRSCGTALVTNPTLRSPIQDKRNAGAEVYKILSGQGAEISPPFKEGLSSSKKGAKLGNDIRPRVIPKFVQTSPRAPDSALVEKPTLGSPIQNLSDQEISPLYSRLLSAKKVTGLVDDTRPRVFPQVVPKSQLPGVTLVVEKPSLGSPILSKPITGEKLLNKTYDQESEVASICNSSNLLSKSLTEKSDSTRSLKVSLVAQKSLRAEETTVMTPVAKESFIQKSIASGISVPPLKKNKQEMIKLTAAGKQVFDELFPDKKIPSNFVEILNKELSKRGHPPATVIEAPKVAQKSSHGTTPSTMTPATEFPAQVKAVDMGIACVVETPKFAQKSGHLDSGTTEMMTSEKGSSALAKAVNVGTACVVETPKVAQKSGHVNSGTTGIMTSETGSPALEEAVNVCIAGDVGNKVTPKLSHIPRIVGVPPITKPKKAAIKLTAEGGKVLGELFPDKKLPPNFMDILNAEFCKRGIPSATVRIENSGVSENPIGNQMLARKSGTKVTMMSETGSPSRISELTIGLPRPDLLPRKPLQTLEKNVTSIKRKKPFEDDVNDPALLKIRN